MPPRTLATLAHALSVAPDLDAALLALADALTELDRFAVISLVRFDARRSMLTERFLAKENVVVCVKVETTFDHFPTRERMAVSAGGAFVEMGDTSDDYAPLFALDKLQDQGWLALRGIKFEGELSALLVLYEARKFFGSRTSERFAPSAALFDIAFARFAEHEARDEAVRTLEDVTSRVHTEYAKKLTHLESQLSSKSEGVADQEQFIALEREATGAKEVARRATRRAEAVDAQVMVAVEQLEKAHIELHRLSEDLRQRSRTLYLIDRALTLDAAHDDPVGLVNALLTLVGDDMAAERCSLLLAVPDQQQLYVAAAKGLSGSPIGQRVQFGEGVAGKVAQSREPLLVQDVTGAHTHPLIRDELFSTGSFISFPLIYHDTLVGVVNVANKAMHGIFVEDDVERIRLLALVMALVATRARLADRMLEKLGVS